MFDMSKFIGNKELYQWIEQAKQQAIAFKIPLNEIDWLLQELTNLDRLSLRLLSYEPQTLVKSEVTLAQLDELWKLRVKERLPVQYLVGKTYWRHFSLKVTPDVLIPRPETECIIDLVLEILNNPLNRELRSGNWVDLGTGSGAIAIGLASILPQATIHAVDFSAKALAIAAENAFNLGYSKSIKFYQGYWWDPLVALSGKISGMVSNPPYIPSQLVPQLPTEVTQHEPHLALDGGSDGLDAIRYLAKTAPKYLISGGIWLVEMMQGQSAPVTTILETQDCYANIKICKDLAGVERFAIAQYQPKDSKRINNSR
jgi:release factor glutamine methyltransferase